MPGGSFPLPAPSRYQGDRPWTPEGHQADRRREQLTGQDTDRAPCDETFERQPASSGQDAHGADVRGGRGVDGEGVRGVNGEEGTGWARRPAGRTARA
ncbi:hypothetical protein [Streptomyces rugosispiralis]|uniref:Uncharacterized protein n=1 Tax=Streptomyces rugosispiralis TaxID=2967341 RepID=A0ABT1VDR3_9ACTN|nr:hypothetical protein [Streptomyces rugosispiralis]MCQ8195530.1 hypothetical protein [Streptomyces rugosispiralis]